MRFLDVLVLAVGALGLVNLLLAFAIVRRLREHAEMLAELPGDSAGRAMRPANDAVQEFSARTVEDELITSADLAPGTLVGFFSPGCPPCEEQLPLFAATARGRGAGRTGVLAVVVGPADRATDLVRELLPVARVVVEEDPDGAVAKAFGVKGYPSTCVVDRNRAIQPVRLRQGERRAQLAGRVPA